MVILEVRAERFFPPLELITRRIYRPPKGDLDQVDRLFHISPREALDQLDRPPHLVAVELRVGIGVAQLSNLTARGSPGRRLARRRSGTRPTRRRPRRTRRSRPR